MIFKVPFNTNHSVILCRAVKRQLLLPSSKSSFLWGNTISSAVEPNYYHSCFSDLNRFTPKVLKQQMLKDKKKTEWKCYHVNIICSHTHPVVVKIGVAGRGSSLTKLHQCSWPSARRGHLRRQQIQLARCSSTTAAVFKEQQAQSRLWLSARLHPATFQWSLFTTQCPAGVTPACPPSSFRFSASSALNSWFQPHFFPFLLEICLKADPVFAPHGIQPLGASCPSTAVGLYLI